MTGWRTLRVSDDGTRHLGVGDAPAYPPTFDAVLPFHEPGLAPVRLGAEAWHIDPHGQAAYSARYLQTFGFYEGCAAVVDGSGWFHVLPDGTPLYRPRFAWCGNMQGGRVVGRREDGRYIHLLRSGEPLTPANWRYAGDFREGCAVVQRDDGLHSHIDSAGALVHHAWFLDLDVFHKGVARARDARGWTHVDRRGVPVSTRRFAMVEPFYNGQARVERFDGALEVIEPSGRALVQLRDPTISPVHAASGELVGYWRTEAVSAASQLRVLEALPANAMTVAHRCSMPSEAASRLLRALWEMDLVEPAGESWILTSKGRVLTSGHERSLHAAVAEYAGPLSAAWKDLPDLLRGVRRRRGGIFRDIAADPVRLAEHHRMLAAYADEDYASLVPCLPTVEVGTVVDAGGGTGTFARRLADRYPGATVVLLDLPPVAARASGPFKALGADLFEPWPVVADVIVMARVLHDWDDDDATRLLERARAALNPGGQLCGLEMVLAEDAPGGGLCDLHLLATTGGRERTARQWGELLDAAGFSPPRIENRGGVVSLLCATVR